MFRGFYTAAAGMLAQMQRQNMITQNLSNANTPGYKADEAAQRSFPQQLIEQIGGKNSGNGVGVISSGVYLQEKVPDFSTGSFRTTNINTDFALQPGSLPVNPATGRQGGLFFTVRMPDGSTEYTRNGHFTLDGNGTLVTSAGHPVLDTDGSTITMDSADFSMDASGRLSNGSQVNIAYAPDPSRLVRTGSGLFRTENGAAPLATAVGKQNLPYQLKQGVLEQSNVNLEKSATAMMTTYRNFEMNQKVLQAYDETMKTAATDIGSIN